MAEYQRISTWFLAPQRFDYSYRDVVRSYGTGVLSVGLHKQPRAMRERWRVVARACSILLPGTLALLGCATSKPSPSSISTPAIGIHHFVRPGETLAAIGRIYG